MSSLRKMDHGWSQCSCARTVLLLEQNKGAHWYRVAYWNKGAYSVGALIDKNKSGGGGTNLKEGAWVIAALVKLIKEFVAYSIISCSRQSRALWNAPIRPQQRLFHTRHIISSYNINGSFAVVLRLKWTKSRVFHSYPTATNWVETGAQNVSEGHALQRMKKKFFNEIVLSISLAAAGIVCK